MTDATVREGPGVPRKVPTPSSSAPVPRPPIERLERGSAVGRYIVIDLLGEGGMGVVYSAFDPELDRKVAIKLLQARSAGISGARPGSAGPRSDAKRREGGIDQARLLREAQAMARLSHPNVIAVHDVGTLPGDRVFVAMEHVEGETLRAWLKPAARPWRDVLHVMQAAGAGLVAAHAGGLVHRDFKPDNVLVGRDGRVRVMDFGLARLRSDDDSEPFSRERSSDLQIESRSPLSESITIAGTVVGTPAYMAPELYEGRAADARSDQFAFGVALYEALFRQRPFAKDQPRTKPKPPPASDVPARIQRVVLRAVSAHPNDRFSSIEEMLRELAVDPAARRRRILVGAGAVAALGAAVIGGFALSSSAEPGAAPQLCKGADRRLAGVWDEPVKLAVGAAFGATRLPFAQQSLARLSRGLDTYATEWATIATDACEATRIRGEQTEDVMSLRSACLDDRLAELRAVTQLFAKADRELVERGDQIVQKLEPLARCSNVAALRAPGLPPSEPKDKLDELHVQLADAKAALVVGRYFPAIDAADKAAPLADAVHYAPYKAEALLVKAASLVGAGNIEEAATTAAEGVWASMLANRDDLLAGAAQLAAVVAAQSRISEAKIWLGLARTAAQRAHDPLTDLRQLQVDGVVAAASGDLPTAITAIEKALALARSRVGPDNPVLWTEEELIGVTYAKSGAWDKAAPHFERAIQLHEISVGHDHSDIALILTNLGPCYSHMGNPAKAKATYERAIAIREHLEGGERSPMLILALNNMADGLIKAGDIPGALAVLERGMNLATRYLGTANPLYHNLATTHAEALVAAGRLAEAHAEYEAVIAAETQASSPILGPTLGSRAQTALGEKKWAEAQSFAQRAVAAIEALAGKDAPDLWGPLAALGRAELELGRPADARPHLARAIAIAEKSQISEADLAPVRKLLAR